MKFIGHKFAFAVAVAFLALVGKGDDAVGILRVDTDTNNIVAVEMPFDAIAGNVELGTGIGPANFISGTFMGDGSIFSDRLYRFPLTTNDYALTANNYAFYTDGVWLDSGTLSNSTMNASSGDMLYLFRTDDEPFSFFLHGRLSLPQSPTPNSLTPNSITPSLHHSPLSPIFTYIFVDPIKTNAVVAFETDRIADLFVAQSETNVSSLVWTHLGRYPNSLSFLYPLTADDYSLTTTNYPLTTFLVSDATRDTDGDGLPDAMEDLVYRTNPFLADTDGDGVNDSLEIAWGRSPIYQNPIPMTLFSESFEKPLVTPGFLNGQNGWIATTGAVVQIENVNTGSAALEIHSISNEIVHAVHSVSNQLSSQIWIDFYMSIGCGDDIDFPLDENAVISIVFDKFTHPVMIDGESVVTNTLHTFDAKERFHRLTLFLDFDLKTWDCYVDRILVGEKLAMRGEKPSLNEMVFSGNAGAVDDIAVTTSRPKGLSSDSDKMADEWEIHHFGNLSRDGTLDFDSDGLTDAEEYCYGADPKNSDTDSDGIPDLWEVLNGFDPANPADAALDPDKDGLTNAEEFRKGGDPNFSEPDPTLRMPGLFAEYWRTPSNLQTLPGYESLMPSHVSVSPVVDHPAVPWIAEGTMSGDGFAACYTGYIRIPQDGDYVFYLTSDDGSALFIDGVTVVSNTEPHSAITSYGTATLSAGWHSVEVRYYENTGSESVKLEWSSEHIPRAIVPTEALCHLKSDETPRGFVSGITASFYTLPSGLTSLPDFSTLAPVDTRIVPSVDEPETSGSWRNAPVDLLDNFGAVYEGYLYVPRSGRWEMKLSSDDGSRLYIDGTLAIDHDGAHSDSTKMIQIPLSRGLHTIRVEYFEITGSARLQLSWALSGFPSEAIPSRFFYRESGAGTDVDSDGIPDWWEEKNGLDPSDPADAALDPDGDGLSNAEEAAFGSDPRLVDTDGDGMSDGWETRHGLCAFIAEAALDDPDGDGLVNLEEARFGTDPNLADTDGDGADDFIEIRNSHSNPLSSDIEWMPIPVGSVVSGASFASSTGTWRTDEAGTVFAAERAGSLTWRLSVPEEGADALAVRIGQHNPYSKAFEFDLSLKVDGVFVARELVFAEYGSQEEVYFFLPEIPHGEYEFKITWHNWEVNTFLSVYDLRFVKFGGPDLNGDGIADWKNYRFSNSSEMDALPCESLVSPLCVEGRDLWCDVLEIDVEYPETNAVYSTIKTISDGFYADIPLPLSGSAIVSMKDRELSESFPVVWKSFDVFTEEYATNALLIRAGDSLKIAPYQELESEITISIANGDNNWRSVTNWNASTSMPYCFTTNGLYLIEVTRKGLFSSKSAYGLVDVVSSRFPKRNPAILMDMQQTLTCPDLSPRNILEYDSELKLDAEIRTKGVELSLFTSADRNLGMVSRLAEGGAISDAVQVTPIWADNGTYYRVAENYSDGSQLIVVSLLFGAVAENMTIELEIFVSGVTFEDGSRFKTLTAKDLDENGHYTIRFIRARGVTTSVCHRTYIYQDGKLLYTNK